MMTAAIKGGSTEMTAGPIIYLSVVVLVGIILTLVIYTNGKRNRK